MTRLDISKKHNTDATRARRAPQAFRSGPEGRREGSRKGCTGVAAPRRPCRTADKPQPQRQKEEEKPTCSTETVNKAHSCEPAKWAFVTRSSPSPLKNFACLESRGRGSKSSSHGRLVVLPRQPAPRAQRRRAPLLTPTPWGLLFGGQATRCWRQPGARSGPQPTLSSCG